MMEILGWIWGHKLELSAILASAVSTAQLVVRLTPTKKDDSFLERIGGVLDAVFGFLKIPNNLKK